MYDPANPATPAQDRPRPVPPEPSRQDALGRLKRERWHAENAGELELVAEIDQKIKALSAQTTSRPPARETTSATTPRERRATPPRKK